MEHHFDADTVTLHREVLFKHRVGSEEGQIERLSLHFLVTEAKDALLFLQLEDDLLFLETPKHLGEICGLKLVLEGVLLFLDVEVALNQFAILVVDLVLNVGGTGAFELGVPLELDLELVGLQLGIGLFLVNHGLDFFELGRRLERVLYDHFQVV